MNEATFAAAWTCCKSFSEFFSEQSAQAIKSLNVNLKTKPSLLLNMEGMTTNGRNFTVGVSALSESQLRCLSNKTEKEEDVA